ncbi:CFEM domain-containing protein [Colletotrichum karsti]|uniref:CFEM domain-containing protein n=1 Tax=Colletotrichum karsti TaxID=1095194 RepID=A0A9P6HSS3_9PEZI|nr:CFEM domain-containing protein [Colletotrichum karsti]KAF9869409.1 CFEM domain-containing protein [Colletotrichum karsti]
MGPIQILPTLTTLATLVWVCRGEVDLSQRDTNLPECAASCWRMAIPSMCGSWENAQCICQDTNFDLAVTQCMTKSCPRLSTFATLREWDTMCDKPRGDRKGVWPFLPVHLFAMICVLARLYSKSWVIRRFGTDDWVITITYILYIGWFSIGHHIFQKAFGTDIWWTDADTLTWALKLFYIDAPIYLLILGLTKISILCFYLRLFPYQRFCRLCYVVLAIVTTSTSLWVVLAIIQCRPISYNWEGWKGDFPGPVHCVNLNVLSWTTSAFSIALDTIILIMPMPLIIRVKSTPRRKFAIISMFSLGIIIVIASCLRLRFNILYGDSVNITWDYVDLMIWTGVEVATSITVTSLPSIRLMLHRLFPGFFARIFAFGGHVEEDREQYLEIRETQHRDIEQTGAKGVIRRLRIAHKKHEPPLTVGGGTPQARERRASAAAGATGSPGRPARTEASRVLASIMGSIASSFRDSTSTARDSVDDSITVTTEITITTQEERLENGDAESSATQQSRELIVGDERSSLGIGDWSDKKWDWNFSGRHNEDFG